MGLLTNIAARVSSLLTVARGSWSPIIREPYTGAWQLNDALPAENALANPSVFGVVSRIAQDIAKIAPPLLLELDEDGFWFETTNSAYTPVLRRPNRYQTAQQFYESWMFSKLLYGNTYVLKERDERGVVKALSILDPLKVKPLVAPDGSVYYELQSNELAGLPQATEPVVVGASDLIHDRWNCLWHPLVGVSPLYAIGGAVTQAQAIQASSTTFFAKGGRPAGMLVAPTKLDPASAERIKSTLANFKTGEIMLTDQGMTYHDIGGSAVDSELIAQLGWTEEKICEVFGMPISILNSNKQPPYANAEASQLQYKSQCLEPHLASIAATLGEGLELPLYLSLEFDDTLLIWMDTATRTTAAKTAIAAGMSVNEVRDTYYGLGPVPGGEVPYLQQQYIPIDQAAEGPAPMAAPLPPAAAGPGDAMIEFSRVPLPPLLTLAQAKGHLHLTDTAYDTDVQEILDTAQEAILACINVGVDPTWDAATAPKPVTHAIKLLLGYYYAERGDGGVPNPWPAIYDLLAFYRDPTVA